MGKCIIASSIIEGINEDNPENILKWCQIANEKYIDRDFPASFVSLSHQGLSSSKYKNWSKFRWIRASECFASLEIFKKEVSPLDIIQGALGDINFLCALSCLSENPEVIHDMFLIKSDNSYGVYSVKLCKDGIWKAIVIDEFFPCGGDQKIPCFSQSTGGAIWVIILEKAWAKVNGSYENTESTSLVQCLRDLTGAPTYIITCNQEAWEQIVTSKENNYILCASASSTKSSQKLLEGMGLIGSLSYAVIQTADVGEKIIQLRNPWSKAEWNGDWSDTSSKWTPKIKNKLNFNEAADGKFWMSFTDFIEYFSCITVCELSNYKYSSIITSQDKDHYNIINFEITVSGEYTISIDQKDALYMNTIENYNYSCARLIICKESRGSLNYVIGIRACERNLLKKLALRRGKYFIFVMFDWEYQEREYVLSVYGPEIVIFEVLGQVEGFLENLYKNKALSLDEYTTYQDTGLPDCVKYYEILPEGFGYFYILNNNPKQSLIETKYFKKFTNLMLMPPYSGTKYTVTVGPNSGCIILLQVIKNDKYAIDFSFTPSINEEEILIVN